MLGLAVRLAVRFNQSNQYLPVFTGSFGSFARGSPSLLRWLQPQLQPLLAKDAAIVE